MSPTTLWRSPVLDFCSGMTLFVFIGTGAAVFFSNPKTTDYSERSSAGIGAGGSALSCMMLMLGRSGKATRAVLQLACLARLPGKHGATPGHRPAPPARAGAVPPP